MALNVSYAAWAIVFTVILFRDLSVLNPMILICAIIVLICGILVATDCKELIQKMKEHSGIQKKNR